MEYVKTKELDLSKTFFHFTQIDNRDSIEQNDIVAVAGGENEAINDGKRKAIYFSYGVDGMLKAIDVWIKWEYNRLRKNKDFKYSPVDKIDEEIMTEVYQQVYEDFKNRNYYSLDLIEGEDPETSDFSFHGVDMKKQDEYIKFLQQMREFEEGKLDWKPTYPNKTMKWMYGSYSNFENDNVEQDNWNMNTHIGERTIPRDRFKIIEGENGRTDGLSIAFEMYDRYREQLADLDLTRLDDFIKYAKERYKSDKDFMKGASDYGRRPVNPQEEEKYQRINKITFSAARAFAKNGGTPVALESENAEFVFDKVVELDKSEPSKKVFQE